MVTLLKTGVEGLDSIFKGGVREGSNLLLIGPPGTGKSILTMQFLVEGAKNKEPGLCILYESEIEDYLLYADSLKIPLRKYVDAKIITIIKQSTTVQKIPTFSTPLEQIKKGKVTRIVLDSLTMFGYIHSENTKSFRFEVLKFLSLMKGYTLLATAESADLSIDKHSAKTEEFLFDGVIHVTKIRQESTFERVLNITKIRGQQHLLNIYPFFIEEGGVHVYPDQLPFALISHDENIRSGKKVQKK
ncbi:hypothetical protein CL620_06040 [archaeon]|nr:hypothetical protein [archaeon]